MYYGTALIHQQLKNEKFIHEGRIVSAEVRARLPKGFVNLGFVLAKDMYEKECEAILVRFLDSEWGGMRIARFRLETGEYMDDYVL